MKTISLIAALMIAATAHAQSQQSGELPPRVKGLCIGMDFDTAKSWFKEHLSDTLLGYEILPEQGATVFLMFRADLLDYMRQQSGRAQISASGREQQLRIAAKRLRSNGMAVEEDPSFIMADTRGKIVAITMQPDLVGYLFKASNMSAQEFADTFADSYKVPPFQLDVKTGVRSTTTPEGVLVKIERDKSLSMVRVDAPKDVKKAFD